MSPMSNVSYNQLTLSWSLHVQLSAGKSEAIHGNDSLLPPGGGWPHWRGCWLVRASRG